MKNVFPEQFGTGQKHNQDISGSSSFLCLILGLGATGDGKNLQAPHLLHSFAALAQELQGKIPTAFILWLRWSKAWLRCSVEGPSIPTETCFLAVCVKMWDLIHIAAVPGKELKEEGIGSWKGEQT